MDATLSSDGKFEDQLLYYANSAKLHVLVLTCRRGKV